MKNSNKRINKNPCTSILITEGGTIDIPFNNEHIRFENMNAKQMSCLMKLSAVYITSIERSGVKMI